MYIYSGFLVSKRISWFSYIKNIVFIKINFQVIGNYNLIRILTNKQDFFFIIINNSGTTIINYQIIFDNRINEPLLWYRTLYHIQGFL